MIAAARLFSAIATEESPILRAPIIKPQPVLRANFLAQMFERRICPNAVFVRNPSEFGHVARPHFAREGGGKDGLSVRCQLQAVGCKSLVSSVQLFCQVD